MLEGEVPAPLLQTCCVLRNPEILYLTRAGVQEGLLGEVNVDLETLGVRSSTGTFRR